MREKVTKIGHTLMIRAIFFDKFDLQYSASGGFENSGGKAVLLWNFKFQHPEWVRSLNET